MYNSKADLFDEISVRQIGSFLPLYIYFGLILLLQNAGTAQYVILYDIRYKVHHKVHRQSSGVTDLLARFLDVLHNISPSLALAVNTIQNFKITAPKFLQEVRILPYHLPLTSIEVIVIIGKKCSRHRTVGNMKDTVKVQPFRFWRAFPYADVPPFLAGAKKTQTILQLLSKRSLGMLWIVVGKGNEVVKLLQIRLAGHSEAAADQIPMLAFQIRIDV